MYDEQLEKSWKVITHRNHFSHLPRSHSWNFSLANIYYPVFIAWDGLFLVLHLNCTWKVVPNVELERANKGRPNSRTIRHDFIFSFSLSVFLCSDSLSLYLAHEDKLRKKWIEIVWTNRKEKRFHWETNPKWKYALSE